MSWIAGRNGTQRRPRRAPLPVPIEILETRALLATVTVHVVNFAFTPDPVTIHVGDTVHWVWDTDDHSTTSVAGSAEQWDSGVHNTGFMFDHTFMNAGPSITTARFTGATMATARRAAWPGPSTSWHR